MLVVNVDYVPDKELKVLALVKGIGADNLFQKAELGALEAMKEEANQLKADAIVNVRFESVSGVDGKIQILAYGTAVKYREAYELQQF